METKFECRYTQDWAYTKTLYAHTRKQSRPIFLLWGGLACILFLMVLDNLVIYRDLVFGPFYLLMLLYALWRGFGGHIRVRRRWKKTCKQRGKDSIETVFRFGDKVRLSDDSGVAIEFGWDMFEKAYKLKELGPYLKFEATPKKDGNLYLPKAGFEDGTGIAFLAWIKEEHPGLMHK